MDWIAFFIYYIKENNVLNFDNLINLCIMVKNAGPQFEQMLTANLNLIDKIYDLYKNFKSTTVHARELLKNHPEYIYFTSLGHKYYFEHTTTADKLVGAGHAGASLIVTEPEQFATLLPTATVKL